MITVLSGAGMSAESGIRTFRDNNGLWEDHDVMDVASPEGWARDQALVNRFYNARRAQLKEVKPNAGHLALAELEKLQTVRIITQNVDDLHERAGSKNVLHLHGELRKVRSTGNPNYVVEWSRDLSASDKCPAGFQLRPHIVWFGEAVPALDAAIPLVQASDVVIVVGTSMQVYPAASLVGFAPAHAQVFYVDPYPQINHELSLRQNLQVIEDTAAGALPELCKRLKNNC